MKSYVLAHALNNNGGVPIAIIQATSVLDAIKLVFQKHNQTGQVVMGKHELAPTKISFESYSLLLYLIRESDMWTQHES